MAKKEETINPLVAKYSPKSVFAEAYRTLRTNLSLASLEKPNKIILVTSPGPADGKSTTAANLAVVLAQAGNKVILVDCDMRKPKQHKMFDLDNSKGLTNCLFQNLPPQEVIHTGQGENLAVMPCGPIPPNPAEILVSDKVKLFWNSLAEQFDYVIIDAPPVLAVTDSVLLASQVDGVILVVRSGVTRTDIVKNARDQLLRGNGNVIGVVLNRVKTEQDDHYYYYYYHENAVQEQIRL